MNVLKITFAVLWLISFIVWLVWCIGYPIAKKLIKKEYFDWNTYSIGLLLGSACLNIFNLLMRI